VKGSEVGLGEIECEGVLDLYGSHGPVVGSCGHDDEEFGKFTHFHFFLISAFQGQERKRR
jgi:hypothetical protein